MGGKGRRRVRGMPGILRSKGAGGSRKEKLSLKDPGNIYDCKRPVD
jgi:hypothetical protein